MANSAGRVPSGNDGKTDKGRGSEDKFSYSKESRKTGKTGRVGKKSNMGQEFIKENDPRLA